MDEDRARVVLLSCDDAECTTWTDQTIATFTPGEISLAGFAIALDDEDRPLIAVGVQIDGFGAAHPGWDGTVIQFRQVRCNAG